MLTKTWNADDNRYDVTFDLPDGLDIEGASVVGEFNDWDPAVHPMSRDDDGRWTATLALEPGTTHRFRYQLDGTEWENDWSADDYVPNDFGGADSIIEVPGEPTEPPPAKKAPAKKAARKKAPAKKAAVAKKAAARQTAIDKKGP